jgi:hypothetical protein
MSGMHQTANLAVIFYPVTTSGASYPLPALLLALDPL